mmetsp:Transcript_14964/g.28330  ORF Transcript_14964/g.28330 Transcript_14964/m.28330 type:complete len:85 (-) Transcript_14964:153-407(-)|eukprot:scaffold42806_cov237-Amphora_coffeaeformis.AAC.7
MGWFVPLSSVCFPCRDQGYFDQDRLVRESNQQRWTFPFPQSILIFVLPTKDDIIERLAKDSIQSQPLETIRRSKEYGYKCQQVN